MFARPLLVISAAVLASVTIAEAAPASDLEIHGRCAVQRVEPDPSYRARKGDGLLYINRCEGGCTLTPGSNDSRYDTSTIFGATVTLSEFEHGDEVWDEMMDCIRYVMRPYNVEITDQDPGTGAIYQESMAAGTTGESGLGQDILGISPLAGDCSPLSHTISFAFANSHAAEPRALCETVTHEAGHTLGLEHVVACADLLWWTAGGNCGPKFFRDALSDCGEGEPEDCFRGGTQQNSHQKVLDALGGGVGAYPPHVRIELPKDGDEVDSEFIVYATARDIRGIARVELIINGWTWLVADGKGWNEQHQPYVLRTPKLLPDGILDIRVRVYNDLGLRGAISITAQKGEPCTSEASCLDAQVCDDGRCQWPPASKELGDDCDSDQECKTSLCADYGDGSVCATRCTAASDDMCEDGFACVVRNAAGGVCLPHGGAGCCSTTENTSPQWPELALFAGVILLVSRRRRRR